MHSENVQCDTVFFSEHKEAIEILKGIVWLAKKLVFEAEETKITYDDTLEKHLPNLITRINTLCEIVGKYMNNQILLYRYVESLVGKVFTILKEFILLPNTKKENVICYSGCKKGVPLIVLEHISHYLYIVGKCIGIRRLIANAPNDIHLLNYITVLIEMIQGRDSESFDVAINKYEDHKWCLEYILLSWQSLLIYTPFELERIWKNDSRVMLKDRIINIAIYYINKPTKARDGAAMVISNLFSRSDIANSSDQDFPGFLDYCKNVLTKPLSNDYDNKETNGHSIIGVLIFIKKILKRMPRSNLVSHLETFEFLLLQCGHNIANSVCRKLHARCLGRLALHILPSQSICQKYKISCKTILSAVSPQNDIDTVEIASYLYKYEDDKTIETIVSKLLEYLCDKDIRVRWASAKAIGRMSMKLRIEYNQQIASYILDLMSLQFDGDLAFSVKSEGIVHGGCLAIAEIIRNGILYPDMLRGILDCTISTLSFDIWRGKGSAGTAVRDASCYILWAISRNFKSETLNSINVVKICESLINVAIFDLSINCRRAAGAVLQELVGRHNSVPFGLDIISIVNYYSISNRQRALVEISYNVAKLGFYNISMIRHLVRTKLYHPDIETRELSAIALSKIVFVTPNVGKINLFPSDSSDQDPMTIHRQLIQVFISDVTHKNVSTTHGALRGLTRILSHYSCNLTSIQDYLHEIIMIPVVFEKKRLFRGKGGNIIRESICKLIGTICKFKNMSLCESDVFSVYIVILKDCIRNFSLAVQLAAVEALQYLLIKLVETSPPAASSILNFLIDSLKLKNEHVAARRGYALAISTVPLDLLDSDTLEKLLFLLCHEIRLNAKCELVRDAQTRQFSLLSILVLMDRSKTNSLSSAAVNEVVDTINVCCHDYEVDTRGDVGSWVRELTSEVIFFILMQYFKNVEICAFYKSLDCEAVTNLTHCLIELSFEVSEHVRARSVFLFSHLFFQKGDLEFEVEWLWNRIFYGIPYERNISRDISIESKRCQITKEVIGEEELESISSKLILTMKMLSTYDDGAKSEIYDDSFGVIYRTVSEKMSAALRIYGWSSATLVFKDLLKMLLLPKYTYVVVSSIVKICGSNLLNDSFIDPVSGEILVLENILIKFISAHKNDNIFWDGSLKKLEDIVVDCILDMYEKYTVENNSKTCSKIMCTIKLFASHNLVASCKWNKGILMIISEAKRTTNYSYLKTIIKCLQALYTSTDMDVDIMDLLLWFLSHKYPTIRTYTSSVLTLILTSMNCAHIDEIIDVLTTFPFDTENVENISNMIQMLKERLTKC